MGAYDGQGFDEYMNVVLDEAEEVNTKTNTRKSVGKFQIDFHGTVSNGCCYCRPHSLER